MKIRKRINEWLNKRKRRKYANDWYFYNLDNGRPDKVINRELKQMLDLGPAVVAGAEATGFKPERHENYRLLRDTTNKSRENIIVYIRRDLKYNFIDWLDMRGTWPRTEYKGTHEPRSFPLFVVDGILATVVHFPPNNARGADVLQAECVNALAKVRGLGTAIGDFNGRKGEKGIGPDTLAQKIGGRTIGARIDCAVVADRFDVSGHGYPEKINGVPLRSDHHRAFWLRFKRVK